MNTNPFTDEFVKGEIKFMELDNKNNLEYKGVRLVHKTLHMQVDDYLNRNFRIGELTVPVFFIDGKLWMSLTPMEIESNFLAWATATGEVGMGGLGIGYTALRAASQEDVYNVTVFEQDKRVIEFFTKQYEHRPEFEKIKIIEGDARKLFIGYDFDFVFMDIYDSLLSDEMLTDFLDFTKFNNIGEYHFWSEEKIILAGIQDRMLPSSDISYQQRLYFQEWQKTEKADMYDPVYDTAYVQKALETMGFEYAG